MNDRDTIMLTGYIFSGFVLVLWILVKLRKQTHDELELV